MKFYKNKPESQNVLPEDFSEVEIYLLVIMYKSAKDVRNTLNSIGIKINKYQKLETFKLNDYTRKCLRLFFKQRRAMYKCRYFANQLKKYKEVAKTLGIDADFGYYTFEDWQQENNKFFFDEYNKYFPVKNTVME